MDEKDIQLKLLANIPIDLGFAKFQLPSVSDVIYMGESTYNSLLSLMLFSKESLTIQVEEFEKLSDFEILINLIYHDVSFRNMVFNAFATFLDVTPHISQEGIIYFGEFDISTILTEDKWEELKNIIKIGNFIPKTTEEEYKAGNERARKFLEAQKKRKEMIAKAKKKDEKINLHSIISAVAWRTVGFNEVLKLTIYQLYDGFYRLGLIDNYHYTFTGIYTGNIDGSKIKLPDINWANMIKINN
jgi:hypothetical protein